MKLVLIGYMGCGKSAVGIELATVLGFQFIDLDNQIELVEGRSVSEIFKEKGEIYFRKLENRILKELVHSEDNVVISTGGGTPCYGDIINFLSSQDKLVTIYLQAGIQVLADRLFKERLHRPLIAHLDDKTALMDFIRKHLFERSFYYNQVKLKIDVENSSAERIVQEVVLRLF